MLDKLQLLYHDINRVVVDYDTHIPFSIKPTQIWELHQYAPLGIITDTKFLYFCDSKQHSLRIYNLDTKQTIIEKKFTFCI